MEKKQNNNKVKNKINYKNNNKIENKINNKVENKINNKINNKNSNKINNKNNNKKNNNIIQKENNIKKQNEKNNYIKNNIIININKNKIISISGVNGKIKSVLILLILNYLKNNKKILIINMDFLNDYLSDYLYENNIYYKDGRDIIFKEKNLNKYLNKIKKQFDIIIINTSHESFYNYNKKLIEESDKNYFIIKNDNLEISKSIYLFEIYTNKWKIENKKIDIIINK